MIRLQRADIFILDLEKSFDHCDIFMLIDIPRYPLTFILALVAWAVIPFGEGLVIADINVGILYLFAISSLGVYGVIMAGWASNSKYAFLGALRSAAQMVSYEVSMGLIIITVVINAARLVCVAFSPATFHFVLEH